MDPDILTSTAKAAPRKVRYAPKAPKREQKPVLPKVEKIESEIDTAQREAFLRKLNDPSLMGRPKVEKKPVAAEVAFGYGGSKTSIRGKGYLKSQASSSNGDSVQPEKEYKEPFDYYSNYPITLPIRRPYSGDPEILDRKEFEEEEDSYYDESTINSAEELGLMEESIEEKLIFIQLPKVMPQIEQPTNGVNNSSSKTKPFTLESMPGGSIGKLLIYESGAIKWKIGDTIFDVSSNLPCGFAQEVVAINTEEK